MRIAVGSDHRGGEAVDHLLRHLQGQGHEVLPVGRCETDSCDYPEPAWMVARSVADGAADLGILVCGSGIGVSIAANKVPGIRAALARDAHAAGMSRRHNDANVLCASGDRDDPEAIAAMADAFVNTDFEGGRHARRVEKIHVIERGGDPRQP